VKTSDGGMMKAVRRAPGIPSHESHLAPKHEAEPAPYYFNIRTPSGHIENPEGETYPQSPDRPKRRARRGPRHDRGRQLEGRIGKIGVLRSGTEPTSMS
jgi:hypothetical protein